MFWLQDWYTSIIKKICDWLSDRMNMALHQYQVQTLLTLAAVSPCVTHFERCLAAVSFCVTQLESFLAAVNLCVTQLDSCLSAVNHCITQLESCLAAASICVTQVENSLYIFSLFIFPISFFSLPVTRLHAVFLLIQ